MSSLYNQTSLSDLHCESICAWLNSSVDLHPTFTGDGVKYGLVYYILADLVSGNPQVLLGDQKGTSIRGGEFFEFVTGRGSHGKGILFYKSFLF